MEILFPNYLMEVYFESKTDRIFQKQGLRVKRYACMEVNSGRIFLFNANAEVEIIPR